MAPTTASSRALMCTRTVLVDAKERFGLSEETS